MINKDQEDFSKAFVTLREKSTELVEAVWAAAVWSHQNDVSALLDDGGKQAYDELCEALGREDLKL